MEKDKQKNTGAYLAPEIKVIDIETTALSPICGSATIDQYEDGGIY